MNNYFRTGIMRRMREYTSAVERNAARRDKELVVYEDARGSKLYEDAIKRIDASIANEKGRLTESVRKDLINTLSGMRAAVANKTTKAPTADMVNNLAILEMLDNISHTQLKMYAEAMKDCPLALQKLAQISQKHNLQITVSSPDAIYEGIDRLEGNLVEYLVHFNGNVDQCTSFVVKDLYRYFQPEDFYAQGVKMENSVLARKLHTSAEIDDLLWQKIVGVGTPKTLEEPTGVDSTPVVQYFFSDVEALSSYIEQAVRGQSAEKATEIAADILAACPTQYASAYEDFRANRTVANLNEEEV